MCDATIRRRATGTPIGRNLVGLVGSLWRAKKYRDRREVFTVLGSSPVRMMSINLARVGRYVYLLFAES